MEANIFLPTVAWRTYANNVILLSSETISTQSIYRISVQPIDINDLGAKTARKEVGFYFKDYVGHTYKIIGFTSTTIDVSDDFRIGIGPQSGRQGIVYKSVGDGEAPYLAPIYYRHLDKSALEYSRQAELDILWRNGATSTKIEFTNTATPSITGYQNNYSLKFGQLPKFVLVTYDSAGVEWERQEKPIRNFIDGLLDSVVYDLSDIYSGYIILSK